MSINVRQRFFSNPLPLEANLLIITGKKWAHLSNDDPMYNLLLNEHKQSGVTLENKSQKYFI